MSSYSWGVMQISTFSSYTIFVNCTFNTLYSDRVGTLIVLGNSNVSFVKGSIFVNNSGTAFVYESYSAIIKASVLSIIMDQPNSFLKADSRCSVSIDDVSINGKPERKSSVLTFGTSNQVSIANLTCSGAGSTGSGDLWNRFKCYNISLRLFQILLKLMEVLFMLEANRVFFSPMLYFRIILPLVLEELFLCTVFKLVLSSM
jgi:hypothetical protein